MSKKQKLNCYYHCTGIYVGQFVKEVKNVKLKRLHFAVMMLIWD